MIYGDPERRRLYITDAMRVWGSHLTIDTVLAVRSSHGGEAKNRTQIDTDIVQSARLGSI
jgi:hypothetical protein